ncbi:MAG TPA: hypothetical protein VIU63_07410 [Nitrospira sp.]
MKRFIGIIGFAAILAVGMAQLTFAASDTTTPGGKAAPGEMGAPGAQTIKGDVLKIEGEYYVVKDTAGKEVRLHVDKTSKLDGNFKAGDKIEAQASDKGHALSIKPAKAAGEMSAK